MAERRSLVEGLEDIQLADEELEHQFVFGPKRRPPTRGTRAEPEPTPPAEDPTPADTQAPLAPPVVERPAASPFIGVSRVPVGARVRTEIAAALKRASLERQLNGLQPYSVQDILEDALDLWLLKNGHA